LFIWKSIIAISVTLQPPFGTRDTVAIRNVVLDQATKFTLYKEFSMHN